MEYQLTKEELELCLKGEALADLKQQAGWQILKEWLAHRASHTWVDPRGLKKEEWEWAELNAFHSADVSKQIVEDMDSLISQAEYLRKKQRGEVDKDKFKEFWKGIVGGKKSTTKAEDTETESFQTEVF